MNIHIFIKEINNHILKNTNCMISTILNFAFYTHNLYKLILNMFCIVYYLLNIYIYIYINIYLIIK